MDALAALSLASTVMQFAEYASKLLSQAPKSYKSAHGTLTDRIDVEVLVRDLLSLKQSLKRHAPLAKYYDASATDAPDAENSKALEALHAQCMGAAQDLLAHLARLKARPKGAAEQNVPQKKAPADRWRLLLGADGLEALNRQRQSGMMRFRTWDGFHNALRAVWGGQEMEALEGSIWEIQRDMQLRMLVSFR